MSETFEITDELIAEHGLKADEYQRILDLIGRPPSLTELGIFSAMWNEHCSYKSSKKWLKTLPTTADWVIHGPGENAGVIDIGDGDAIAFKMESHNHPSFIEPYQGAATGVGGILRDVFTMGARPIATMNALRFGAFDHEKTPHLVRGVVAGIGGYGNSFGVPTVGGEINFHPRYNANILVNAMAVGHVRTDMIFTSAASGVGRPIVYLGAKTGRDGIHGATMASQSFDENSDEKRPTVQVGDPFTEKCLMEACLELMQTGAVIAIQDMGAAGLTCSAVEMGARGNLGVELTLDFVPTREAGMSAYEMMLSESQERMLMVLEPSKQAEAEAIFKKWDLDFAVVGQTTDDLRFRVTHNGVLEADLPIKELGDEAPEYDRPWVETQAPEPLDVQLLKERPLSESLLALMASPDLCSRAWVWEQYDYLIRGETLQIPGGDAAVVRLPHTDKAIAISTDCTPRYVNANPFEGGKQAVAETYRNLSAVGAVPLAITDNLNFGNPERPDYMGQFVKAVEGIGAACRALDYPVVSGNVSLYNETHDTGILPTPAIGGVGLLSDWRDMMTLGFQQAGDEIYVVGETRGHLGQSLYVREVHGLEVGDAPHVDLELERKHGAFVRALIAQKLISGCHDVSDGGVLVALTEMAFASGLGADVSKAHVSDREDAFWFGEDQGRYLVTVSPSQRDAFYEHVRAHQIAVQSLGTVQSRFELELPQESIALAALQSAHRNVFETRFSR